MSKPKIFKTKREAIEHLKTEIPGLSGVAFGLVMLQEKEGGETFRVYLRQNQPCYGEMRPYGKDSSRPQDDRPHDLRNPFPAGVPVAVGYTYHNGLKGGADDGSYLDAQITYGPWRRLFKPGYEVVRAGGNADGFILTDTDIPPTPLVQLFMFLLRSSSHILSFFSFKRDHGDEVALWLSFLTHFREGKLHPLVPDSYVMSRSSLSTMMRGEFKDLDGGGTLRERTAYNRPELPYVFESGGDYGLNETVRLFKSVSTTPWVDKELILPKLLEFIDNARRET